MVQVDGPRLKDTRRGLSIGRRTKDLFLIAAPQDVEGRIWLVHMLGRRTALTNICTSFRCAVAAIRELTSLRFPILCSYPFQVTCK